MKNTLTNKHLLFTFFAFVSFLILLTASAQTHADPKTTDLEHFSEYFKTELPQSSDKSKIAKVVILREQSDNYDWYYLSVNGTVIKPKTGEPNAAMDIFELIERDVNKIHPPLDDQQKLKLCTDVAKFLMSTAEGKDDKTKKKNYEKEIQQRGNLSGYFECEKSAYEKLGLHPIEDAKKLEPLAQ